MRTSRAATGLAAAGAVVILSACGGGFRRPNTAPFGHTVQSNGPTSSNRFADLASRLREGTRLRLTLTDGRVDGVVGEINHQTITLIVDGTPVAFPCARVTRVQRRGDSVWSGAIIGAAIIALPAWNGCQNKGRNLTCVAGSLGIFAAIGGLADKSHVGWTTLYVASARSCATPLSPAR
jgi:hypothetical protein